MVGDWDYPEVYFSQKFSSRDMSQTEMDIEDPSSENVQDMEKNNISKYCFDPTVEGGVIAVGVFAINVFSPTSL